MFPLSGLAGLPFTGKTGWGAFSSHCPKDGNIVVLFAPHVGITDQGVVGMVKRQGQSQASSACGAAIAALSAVKNDKTSGNFLSGYQDHQLDCIKHLLVDHTKEISEHENEQVALVYTMFNLIEQFLNDILSDKWMSEKSQLAIIGGIMINIDGKNADRFLPLKFEVRKKD